MNLLQELHQRFGLSDEALARGISQRLNTTVSDCRIRQYRESELPGAIKQAAARWIIEYWLQERDSCESAQLLAVDGKYTRLLRGFTMAEIISMRNSVQAG